MKQKKIAFRADTLNIRELQGLLLPGVAPRHPYLVSTIGSDDRANLAPYSYAAILDYDGMRLVYVPVLPSNGVRKDTALNSRVGDQVVIAAFTPNVVMQGILASTPYPDDEFVRAGLTKETYSGVAPFGVAESPINLVCRVIAEAPVATQPGQGEPVIVQVESLRVDRRVWMGSMASLNPMEQLSPVGRMGGDEYLKASEFLMLGGERLHPRYPQRDPFRYWRYPAGVMDPAAKNVLAVSADQLQRAQKMHILSSAFTPMPCFMLTVPEGYTKLVSFLTVVNVKPPVLLLGSENFTDLNSHGNEYHGVKAGSVLWLSVLTEAMAHSISRNQGGFECFYKTEQRGLGHFWGRGLETSPLNLRCTLLDDFAPGRDVRVQVEEFVCDPSALEPGRTALRSKGKYALRQVGYRRHNVFCHTSDRLLFSIPRPMDRGVGMAWIHERFKTLPLSAHLAPQHLAKLAMFEASELPSDEAAVCEFTAPLLAKPWLSQVRDASVTPEQQMAQLLKKAKKILNYDKAYIKDDIREAWRIIFLAEALI